MTLFFKILYNKNDLTPLERTIALPFLILLIIFLLLIVVIGIVLSIVKTIRNMFRRTSSTSISTDPILKGLELVRLQEAYTPKSVSGMTRIYLPLIKRDFPAFHYDDFRQKAENMLKSVFLAIDQSNPQLLLNASPELVKQVSLQIEQNRHQGICEHFSDVKVHQTEIARYIKKNGRCIVLLQSAVGYVHTCTQNGQKQQEDSSLPQQEKYNIELHYIQDVDASNSTYANDQAFGLTCPNCGAPMKQLGQKTCEYCGSGIVEINAYAWAFARYEKI